MNKFKDIELVPWRYPSNWFRNIKECICFFERRFLRGRYGISHYDCWNLDNYLLKVFKNGIVEFRKDTWSYPGNITEEEWDSILARIEKLITVLQTEGIECEKAEHYWDLGKKDDYLWKKIYCYKWHKAIREWERYRQECLEELCDIMKEWFFHLWW